MPGDGKEKKPSYSSPFNTPIKPAAAPSVLIYPVFPKHSLLKKACIQQGAAPANGMNYTM